MSYLEIEGVSKRFARHTVLDTLSLQVAQGEFLSLLGPSGCGKTTLLRILAGLLPADTGRVRLDGRDMGNLPPHKRNVGVVFQNYALFPHLTVAENIGFGLRARRTPKSEIPARIQSGLAMIRLEAMADSAVTKLSGGQQQRVAMARALATNPALILLDEPLSALDRKLRETMQVELRRLLRQLGMTALFVTHDQDEALALSDRIAVMNAGRIEQLGTPAAIYARPASPFVLDFVGLSTRLAGRVTREHAGEVEVATAPGPVRAPGHFIAGAAVFVAVRPENITLAPIANGNQIHVKLIDRTFLGRSCILHGDASGDDRILVETDAEQGERTVPDRQVTLSWRVADTMLYPAP